MTMPIPEPSAGDLTGLLNRGLAGDAGANSKAYSLVYSELRRTAQRQIRRGGDAATLNPTSLVNEVYLKLSDNAARTVNDRGHFYSLAARAMRQVLVDHQRKKVALKRGSGLAPVELTTEPFGDEGDGIDYFSLHQAIETLGSFDDRAKRVVEWHFFAGLEFAEIGQLLGVSPKTAHRYWTSARAFLLTQLSAAAD